MNKYYIWEDVLTNLINNRKLYKYQCSSSETHFMKCLYDDPCVRQKCNDFLTNIFNELDYDKSKEKSHSFREKGNKFYCKKELEEALNNYNKAIAFAKCNSEESANAYGNRSAVFFELNKYQQSVEDIERAFDSGYVSTNRFKLNKRLIICLIRLGQLVKASQILKKIKLETFNDMEIATISELELKISKAQSEDYYKNDIDNDYPSVTSGSNTNFAFASECIDIRCDENGYNRKVVANRDIKQGEVLFVEPAHASVHIPTDDSLVSFCYHCFINAIALIPCDTCSDMYYCSTDCKNDSFRSYHSYECVGMRYSLWKSIGVAHLAFRVFVKAINNLQKSILFIEDVNKQNQPEYTAVNIMKYFKSFVKSNHGNQSNNYPFVFSLMTNLKLMKEPDALRFALTAVMVIMYLKKYTSFFESIKKLNKEIEMPDEEWELLSLSLMFRHILQQICNAHIIESYPEGSENVLQNSGVIGTALYPAISMMNHSCDPNIENRFYKDIQIIKAARDIRDGSEVFNCYGPNVATMCKKERQDTLMAQYFFRCCCVACK